MSLSVYFHRTSHLVLEEGDAVHPGRHYVLIEEALPSFRRRQQLSFYCSMLRAEIKTLKLDPCRPPRSFGDRDEWKTALKALQTAGVLQYNEFNNRIALALETEG